MDLPDIRLHPNHQALVDRLVKTRLAEKHELKYQQGLALAIMNRLQKLEEIELNRDK